MLAVHPYSCECNSAVEMRREMVIKVAVADRFRFKMVPSIRNLYMLGTREVHYIGGAEVLPAPLDAWLLTITILINRPLPSPS